MQDLRKGQDGIGLGFRDYRVSLGSRDYRVCLGFRDYRVSLGFRMEVQGSFRQFQVGSFALTPPPPALM